MPVYNYGSFIKESIDSVLNQTMIDFELIIINDGSTDNSSEIAHSYLDKRLKIIDLPRNRGNYTARNSGMRIAAGKYICVMDADDLCLPDRLEKQYRFMEENAEFGLIGGAFKYFHNNRPVFRETDYETIQLLLLLYCYLHHPTCMIRSSYVRKYNLFYNESYTYSSDHDWEVRASSLFPIGNINEPLLFYRSHDKQISNRKKMEQLSFTDQIRVNQLSFFGIKPSEAEKTLHIALIKSVANAYINEKKIDRWINRLLESNHKTGYYSQQKLKDCMQMLKYLYINKIEQV